VLTVHTEYSTQYEHGSEETVSVPHALLALLSEEPKYGLRLQSEFEARTGEVWPLNVGQVYTTLQRLERDGLVETRRGERAVAEAVPDHICRADASWPSGFARPPGARPPRDELVIKVLVALQVPGSTYTRSCRCTAGT
jgi:hypothetical protein